MKNVIKIYNKDSYQVIYNWTGCIPDLKLGKRSFVIMILSMTKILELQILELQIQESNLKESLKQVEVGNNSSLALIISPSSSCSLL